MHCALSLKTKVQSKHLQQRQGHQTIMTTTTTMATGESRKRSSSRNCHKDAAKSSNETFFLFFFCFVPGCLSDCLSLFLFASLLLGKKEVTNGAFLAWSMSMPNQSSFSEIGSTIDVRLTAKTTWPTPERERVDCVTKNNKVSVIWERNLTTGQKGPGDLYPKWNAMHTSKFSSRMRKRTRYLDQDVV